MYASRSSIFQFDRSLGFFDLLRGSRSSSSMTGLRHDGSFLRGRVARCAPDAEATMFAQLGLRSEEHTSELQSLMRISYAVFCLKNKNKHNTDKLTHTLII